MSTPSANELYKAAQVLIREGQPVFPCHSHGDKAKRPATKHGYKDASLDKDQVKRWWKAKGDAAIGIPTGVLWDVLDVDTKGKADGRVHLPYLNRLGLLDGCKRLVSTPSGGWHLYFRANPAQNNTARAGLGLDVRGTGGYVLAPPSWIDDGENSVGPYLQHDDPLGGTDDPLQWDLILKTLQPVNETTKKPIVTPEDWSRTGETPLQQRASVGRLKEWLLMREVGERNNSLHWAVQRLLDSGIDPHELEEVALEIGLTEHEVSATINGAIARIGRKGNELVSEVEAMFGTDD